MDNMKSSLQESCTPNRREFGKAAIAGALTGKALFSMAQNAEAKVVPLESGIKIAAQMSQNPSEEDIAFTKQLGVDYVCVWTRGKQTTYENFRRIRKTYDDAGLKVWNIGNIDVHNMEEVTLNLPGRDRKVEEYLQYLRNIGKTGGIHYTTYAHMGNGIWSSGREVERGGASARGFDMKDNPVGNWNGKKFTGPLTHGRKYTEKEIWDNYTYFIKKAAPVAEEQGIRIGIHPDDPPVAELGGVPRCIFSNFDGYKRAMEIADSPNIGICLCVGCWLEGGKLMGRDVIDTIHYFGERKKIFKVHFRNTKTPLPHFVESFLDNGYQDMYLVMKALKEVDFRGIIIADHVPRMAKNGGALGYSVGYMRALLERANQEVG